MFRLCIWSMLTHLSWERPEAMKPAAPMLREGGSGRPSPNRWALSGQSMCEKPFHPHLSWSSGLSVFLSALKTYTLEQVQTHSTTHSSMHTRTHTHACIHCDVNKKNEKEKTETECAKAQICTFCSQSPSHIHKSTSSAKPVQPPRKWKSLCVYLQNASVLVPCNKVKAHQSIKAVCPLKTEVDKHMLEASPTVCPHPTRTKMCKKKKKKRLSFKRVCASVLCEMSGWGFTTAWVVLIK